VFGRPLKHGRRSIVNPIFYVTKSGCQWRMLPKDFPSWQTVYDYFKQWCTTGIWETVLDALNKKSRLKQGRQAFPSYGIVDSQSAKTQYNSDELGIDGGKGLKTVSVISWWIPKDICLTLRFMLPIFMTRKLVVICLKGQERS